MSLFKKLFGQRGDSPEEQAAQQRFDQDWAAALKRFEIVTGLGDTKFRLVHPQTKETMTPHEGLAGTFAEWKPLHPGWERRYLLFDLLYTTLKSSMNAWQTANYLVADRRAQDALAVLEPSEPPNSENASYANHCAAFAKVYLSLTRYAEALAWAQKAVEAAPEEAYFQTILADALHLTGQCEAAHDIYDKLMKQSSGSNLQGKEAVAEMFHSLFARETGAVSSPVLALEIAESLGDPEQAEAFWELADTEFYDSPFFQMHYAYHLAKIGATDRSFAKLVALVQKMPWLKEASLNLVRFFEQYDPTGTKFMPEFQAQVRQTIQENHWTNEGMHEIRLEE